MAGFWEEAKYWLDILSSHGVGVKAVSEVCPRAGGLSRRRPHEIIVVVVVVVDAGHGCGGAAGVKVGNVVVPEVSWVLAGFHSSHGAGQEAPSAMCPPSQV